MSRTKRVHKIKHIKVPDGQAITHFAYNCGPSCDYCRDNLRFGQKKAEKNSKADLKTFVDDTP